ncbi:haloacetate dehalogenase [Palleronia salina]|uniref:Haloacetate dehalogenase n=1 Tax=Palleronia salina TaxID=313368 RepID=A0A1M6K6S2_9RHOB|nr:alpha/beta hydrolase [Palleronia salina]SHJ54669.1 haloacetate dehalogenase [Palleronia salina]
MSNAPSDFEAFDHRRVNCGAVSLSVARAGSGPPLVLLHGYPETSQAWHRVAPALAARFDVIVPDLRGYGDSDAPADDADHTVYSKRAMAADIAGLLDRLGIERAHVLGHDRGARVAYRFALDHPDRLRRLGVIEIVPTGSFWSMWTAEIAMAAYHWTFLAQPSPLPERMIGADPGGYLDWTLASWSATRDLAPFSDTALEAYRAQMATPERRAAMCADYRAGATTDRRIDDADRAAGRRIAAPVLFLHGRSGFPARTGDPAGLWHDWAEDITLAECDGGHFTMEEAPGQVIDAAMDFFGAD